MRWHAGLDPAFDGRREADLALRSDQRRVGTCLCIPCAIDIIRHHVHAIQHLCKSGHILFERVHKGCDRDLLLFFEFTTDRLMKFLE